VANPAAGKEIFMKDWHRSNLLGQHSSKAICGYIHASAGFGESTQDNVYAGAASIWENGHKLAENERFQTESSMIIADIDIEILEGQRRKS
jgi:NAD+ synthase (glutamine-hydrolysing)